MKLRIKAEIVLNARETELLATILTTNGTASARDGVRIEAFKKEFLETRAKLSNVKFAAEK